MEEALRTYLRDQVYFWCILLPPWLLFLHPLLAAGPCPGVLLLRAPQALACPGV